MIRPVKARSEMTPPVMSKVGDDPVTYGKVRSDITRAVKARWEMIRPVKARSEMTRSVKNKVGDDTAS